MLKSHSSYEYLFFLSAFLCKTDFSDVSSQKYFLEYTVPPVIKGRINSSL